MMKCYDSLVQWTSLLVYWTAASVGSSIIFELPLCNKPPLKIKTDTQKVLYSDRESSIKQVKCTQRKI